MTWNPYRYFGPPAALLILGMLLAALLFGAVGVLAAVAAGLAAWLSVHVREFRKLVRWLESSDATNAPEGRGAWADVYSLLDGRAVRARQAITAARRNCASLQAAIEALPDGVIRCDRGFRIRWMNLLAARQFELDPLLDRGNYLVHLVRAPDFVAYILARHFDEPCILRCHRGIGAALAIRVVAHGDEGFLLVAHDVSEVERADTIRRDFVANVSHELKTPLTIIGGFAETLMDGDADGAVMARYIGMIHEQSKRMQRIIRDLLTLATLDRPDAGDAGEEDPLVDMEALVQAVVRDATLLSAGRHRIECRVDADLPHLCGRPSDLLLAFANLASNAVHYTPDGGTITFAWRAADGGAEFVVNDTGYGIAPEHIPRLTERFYRVRQGPAAGTDGTGLGLAIVKHVLARYGGELRIASEQGVGSRFAAFFPAACLSREAVSCDGGAGELCRP